MALKRIPFSIPQLAVLLILLMTSCASGFKQPMQPTEPRLGAYSGIHSKMNELPAPQEKIVAAVYQFRDQTGQYKPSESGASWSTAVTQGATSVMLKSLEESGWFTTIEREGLSNLLNERRIIRSSREQYEVERGNQQPGVVMPPLLFGGITLEGGIISYESNLVTGGAGLRYFGAGASGEYRENNVTIYLRAVSTSNGRILKTVHTSKTILSQKVSAGLFRFVSLKQLLEAEAGYTFNEPSHLAVQGAIDKAVYALIIEGILDGLWTVADEKDLDHPSIKAYQEEKEANYQTDYFGFLTKEDIRKRASVAIRTSMNLYDGDYDRSRAMPGASFSLGVMQGRPLSLNLSMGAGRVEAREIFHSNILFADVKAKYRLLNRHVQGSPYLTAGGGLMYHTNDYRLDHMLDRSIPFVTLGAGYEWLRGERSGLFMGISVQQLLDDNIDGLSHGRYNDRIWSLSLGYRFYFF